MQIEIGVYLAKIASRASFIWCYMVSCVHSIIIKIFIAVKQLIIGKVMHADLNWFSNFAAGTKPW